MASPTPDRRTFLTAVAAAAVPAGAAAAPVRDRPAPVAPEPLPPGVAARMGSPAFRHGDAVIGLAFSPDGSVLATTGGDHLAGWDSRTGVAVGRVPFATVGQTVPFLPDADSVMVVDADPAGRQLIVRRFGLRSGAPLYATPTDVRPDGLVAFSPDSGRLASHHPGGLTVLDATAGRTLWTARLTGLADTEPVWSPDGRRVGVVLPQAFVVFDADTGYRAFTFRLADRTPGRQAAFAAGGRWAVVAPEAASAGEKAYACNLLTGRATSLGSLSGVPVPQPLPDGRVLLVTGDDKVIAFDPATGRRQPVPLPAVLTGEAALSPDGRTLAVAAGAVVKLWDVATGKEQPHAADPPGDIAELRFTPDGRAVARLDHDLGWAVWDRPGGRAAVVALDSHSTVALSPDAKLVATPTGGRLQLRDAATGAVVKALRGSKQDELCGFQFTPDGRRLVGWGDTRLDVWDVATGKLKRIDTGTLDARRPPALAADGRHAAVVHAPDEGPAEVRLFDLTTGRRAATLPADPDGCGLAVAPDGRRVATFTVRAAVDPNGDLEALWELVLYDATAGREVWRTPAGPSDGATLAFAPDGRTLVTAAGTRAVAWEVATGGKRATFRHREAVTAAAFTPDGRGLAVASAEAPVFVWDFRGERFALPPAPDRAGLLKLWADLAAADAAVAFRAVRRLARFPQLAVPFLREQLPPAVPPDPDQLKRWVRDLDSAAFPLRHAAAEGLSAAGPPAVALLRPAAESGSPEVRRRAADLLAAAGGASPDRIRAVRAVEAVSWMKAPEARALLATWAGGAPGAVLTTEAKRS